MVSVEFAELYVPVRPGAPTKVTEAYELVVDPAKNRNVMPIVGATLKEIERPAPNVAVAVDAPLVLEATIDPACRLVEPV